MEDETDSLDLKSQLDKGHLPGDFGEQKIIRKHKQDGPMTDWKPMHIWIFLLIAVLVVAGFFTYRHYKNIGPSDDLQDTDPLLEIYTDDYYTYNGYEFKKDINNIWHTEIYDPVSNDLYRVGLHYGPKDLLDIPMNRRSNELLVYALNFSPINLTIGDRRGAVFLLLDPNVESARLSLGYYELKTSLEQVFKMYVGPALTVEHPSRPDIPVRECDKTEDPIIYLKWDQPTQIQMVSENCVIVQGTEQELIRAIDRLILYYYGIMG